MLQTTLQAQAAPSSNPLAVLIVGDERNPKLRAKEEEVIALIRQSMKEQGLPKEVLPILAYHMNKPAEKAYCEKKLGIKTKDLLFIGLAEHNNLVVKKVIVREPNVRDANKSVVNLFRRAVAMITGMPPQDVPTSIPTTAPTVGDTGTSPTMEGVVTCDDVDDRGAPVHRTEIFSRRDTFYVSMEVYGLEIGTSIEARWYRGKELLRQAKVLSDKVGDYYAWFSLEPDKGELWAPGTYRVALSMNGRYKTSVYFRVSAD